MVENTVPVLILAGGEGSRLWPITDMIPKALVPVAGKPCVRWVIDELHEQGFRNIIILINDEDYYQFKYFIQETGVAFNSSPKSTSICQRILNCREILENKPVFLVIYGDDITRTDYRKLVETQQATKSIAVLATTYNVELEFGLIEVDGNDVVGFKEKPNLGKIATDCIWTGRAAFHKYILSPWLENHTNLSDVFPDLLGHGQKVLVQVENSPWYDVGSIAHYRRVNEAYKAETA